MTKAVLGKSMAARINYRYTSNRKLSNFHGYYQEFFTAVLITMEWSQATCLIFIFSRRLLTNFRRFGNLAKLECVWKAAMPPDQRGGISDTPCKVGR